MYLRDEVRERWAAEGVLDRKDPRVEEFLAYINTHPAECWDEYVALFRKDYYDLFDKLVPPLLKSRDKVLRSALIARADPSKPKELDALKQLIRVADPVSDEPELLAIARRGGKKLVTEMKRRKKLTPALVAKLEPPKAAKKKPTPNLRKKPRTTGPTPVTGARR